MPETVVRPFAISSGFEPVEYIIRLFSTRGFAAYVGEPVSQLEHALQAASLAERAGAKATTIVAALLHDMGHLLHNLPESCAEKGIDDRHELLGASWLSRYFGASVVEPVKMHVATKRYLCSVDPGYLGTLSAASVQSLQLQGGPMRPDEVCEFVLRPYAMEAVQVRLWDDDAKTAGLRTPPLGHFRRYLITALRDAEPSDWDARLPCLLPAGLSAAGQPGVSYEKVGEKPRTAGENRTTR
jgi:phosphonate degradation associated HDIG domain protein